MGAVRAGAVVHRARKGRDDAVYAPKPLAGQHIVLAPATIANCSRAETALVRLEDKAEDCEVRTALHRVLARLEAVASIRIEGKRPRLRTILKVESLLAFDGTDSADCLAALDALDFDDADDQQTTLEVLYYQMALARIYRTGGPGCPRHAPNAARHPRGFALRAPRV